MDPALHCGLAVDIRRTVPAVPRLIGSAAWTQNATAIGNDLMITGVIGAVTRSGLGLYLFTFCSPQPDLNYFVYVPSNLNTAQANTITAYHPAFSTTYLKNSFQLQWVQPNVAAYDPEFARVLVFR